jgi:hypothetical protein
MDALRDQFWSAVTKVGYYLEGSYTHRVLLTVIDLIGQLWYFFVAGILITAAISLFWRRESVAAFFQNSSRVSIIGAAIVGIVSPMPTYVAIPLVAALYRVGVPIPVLFAFLVASPLMNPVLFMLTAGAFGYEMALVRLAGALLLGVTAGWLVCTVTVRGRLNGFLCAGNVETLAFAGRSSNPSPGRYSVELARHAYRLTRWAGKYFLLGVIVAALAKNLIPVGWIVQSLGGHRTGSVLVAVAAGIPLYACGGGSIPVMQVLQEAGLDKGAVLAFFISGPATKLSTIVALKAAVTKEVLFLYLGVALVGATVLGLVYSVM